MKKIFAVITLLVLMLAAVPMDARKQAKTSEVTFLTTIDCKNCVRKVEAKLPFEKGVKDMKVDLSSKTVTLKYDPDKTDKEKLAEAIRKLGYEAEEVVPEEKK